MDKTTVTTKRHTNQNYSMYPPHLKKGSSYCSNSILKVNTKKDFSNINWVSFKTSTKIRSHSPFISLEHLFWFWVLFVWLVLVFEFLTFISWFFFLSLFLHIPIAAPSSPLSPPSHSSSPSYPSPFTSEKGEVLPEYQPTLVPQVTAGVVTSSPTEARQESPVRRAGSTGR